MSSGERETLVRLRVWKDLMGRRRTALQKRQLATTRADLKKFYDPWIKTLAGLNGKPQKQSSSDERAAFADGAAMTDEERRLWREFEDAEGGTP